MKHEVWTAALQGVLHPQLFWSPSIVNPDMTFSRSGRDLGEAFRALRFEGIGRLLMEAERLDDGVAIHYSMPSVHAAGSPRPPRPRGAARRPGTSFPANRDGWVGLLDDLGLSFRFLAAPQVEAGALQGKRVLRAAVLDGALRPRGGRDPALRGGGRPRCSPTRRPASSTSTWPGARRARSTPSSASTAPPPRERRAARPARRKATGPRHGGRLAAWACAPAIWRGLEALEPEVRARRRSAARCASAEPTSRS